MSRNTADSAKMENGFKRWSDEELIQLRRFVDERKNDGHTEQAAFMDAAKKFGRTERSIQSQYDLMERYSAIMNNHTPIEFANVRAAAHFVEHEYQKMLIQKMDLVDQVQDLEEQMKNTADKEMVEQLQDKVVELEQLYATAAVEIKALKDYAGEWETIARDEEKKKMGLIEENNRLHQKLTKITEVFSIAKEYHAG